MCTHFTLLAQASDQHYVMHCEHGTVHLVWGRLSLRIHPRDIAYLATLIGRWTADPALAGVRGGGLCWLRDESAGIVCRIAEIGIWLSPDEIAPFSDLIVVSAQRLAVIPQCEDQQRGPFAAEYQPLVATQAGSAN